MTGKDHPNEAEQSDSEWLAQIEAEEAARKSSERDGSDAHMRIETVQPPPDSVCVSPDVSETSTFGAENRPKAPPDSAPSDHSAEEWQHIVAGARTAWAQDDRSSQTPERAALSPTPTVQPPSDAVIQAKGADRDEAAHATQTSGGSRKPLSAKDDQPLPDGFTLYWIEVRLTSPLSEDDTLEDGWEKAWLQSEGYKGEFYDDVWSNEVVRDFHWKKKLKDEKERRDKVLDDRDAQLAEFTEFLRDRGALATYGDFGLITTFQTAADIISVMVAPSALREAVEALHQGTDFRTTACQEMPLSEAFARFVEDDWVPELFDTAPTPGQSAADFFLCVARAHDSLEADATLWRMVGGQIEMFKRVRKTQEEAADAHVEMIVEGLLPLNKISLIIGAAESGKSTLLCELAFAVARKGGDFCGFRVRPEGCKGLPVLICGEDSKEDVEERLAKMSGGAEIPPLLVFADDSKTLKEIIACVMQLPDIPLVIVEPARKYLEGDEDSSTNVNALFNTVEPLKAAKGCAIVMAHHLTKATHRAPEEVARNVRGSGVFWDRPRLILQMVRNRRKGVTVLRIVKSNLGPSANMFKGDILLTYGPGTMRHQRISDGGEESSVPSEQPAAPNSSPHHAADVNAVVAAVRRITAEGGRVTRTGVASLFKQKERAPEIANMSRRQIEDAIKAAIEADLLRQSADGLTVH